MVFLGVTTTLWLSLTFLWLLLGAFVYAALIRQISVRPSPLPETGKKTFGIPEALAATFLMSLLVLSLVKGGASSVPKLSTEDLINNFILTAVVVLVLAGFLIFRGFDLDALAGLSKLGIIKAILIGGILLLMAYPFVVLADALVQTLLGEGSTRQNIVELFSGSVSLPQRMMIIVLAVAVAPVAEVLVFRFFLYGVLKRYFGIAVGLLINALLFAAVHQHLPSFAPLFILGCCFTLAYEWSGYILVSMTMHSLFNSCTLVFLALPNWFQR
jgi:membrane protease YdiL (CAAX protease family)